ncbi:Uncharacterised protein (plasmid) [Tsukamurella tyrosinosolvens]|uniref:Uncharacterized protein n=1 Tax=Tsukamurella tyrosinosolvens TaxID=57704 RepID=A0A1H4UI37_TSUTY|nr:hypothetical protein AXK58_13650 [Tsukamurella tyrosinosolvens]SEC68303.1 hypothetical protein SAMN04489793_2908 [Tsukamurella tyrosinosolvens]VEH94237.1 Uncharacterised protein [Tsukamurella tyrosinosolvens]
MIAALRDASWHNYPDTSSTKKYHLFLDGDALSLCGRAVIADFTAVPAQGVAASDRCFRSECKQGWAQVQSEERR